MTREVQAVLLLLVGGAILRISAGDTYLRYVKESMRPWLILSGAFLVALGVLALVAVLRGHRGGTASPSADGPDPLGDGPDPLGDDPGHPMSPDLHDVSDDGHGHGPGGPRSAWLLLLPVAAIFLIAPPALGAYTAARESSTVLQPADAVAPPLPAGDPVPIMLSDYAARAVWDDGRTLAGRTVEMTGFVTPDPEGGWWLTRLALSCCAADAVATKVKPKDVPDLPANTWVTVTGTWVPGGGTQRDDAVPYVSVSDLRKVPAPSNPYE